jgi:FkbM family methyltransferase
MKGRWARSARPLTPEHVVWAYRLFLDREPENDDVIAEHLGAWQTTQDLRANFLSSLEYRQRSDDPGDGREATVVIKEIAGGLRLFIDLSDRVVGLGILRGHYEPSELEFVRRSVESGQTALDVGAHMGLFAITMASLVGPAGKVFAFEPFQHNADLLERSIAENGFAERVTLERAAVSDHAGTGRLVSASDSINLGGAFLAAPGTELQGSLAAEPVRLTTLDAYPVRRPVSFIKIDIEGAEPLALRGAESILRDDRPIILSELHPAQLQRVARSTPTDFLLEMHSRGYQCHSLEGGRPGQRLTSVSSSEVRTVVFLPETRG